MTATIKASVDRGIVLSGRFVSSAAWEIDSRPMNETMATVMPHPKLDQLTPSAAVEPSEVMLCTKVS